MVQGDYLLYLQIPAHHGCFVQQNSNYVSLSFSAAMPRLMMCARATFQAPSLLLSAVEMKQFPYHGWRYRIACIQRRGGRYYDETPAKTGNLVSARIKFYYGFPCKHYGTGESNLSVLEMMSSPSTEAGDAISTEYWWNKSLFLVRLLSVVANWSSGKCCSTRLQLAPTSKLSDPHLQEGVITLLWSSRNIANKYV